MSSKQPLRIRSTKRFDRAYKRYVGHNLARRRNVDEALRRLAADMNDPHLKTHSLSGELSGSYACSCAFDCRIVFTVEINPKDRSREIILVNVGTHEDVY